MSENPERAFFDRVDATPSCWLWRGNLDQDGYATWRIDGRLVRAHRWSYQHFVGEIPEGLQLDHLCRVRSCVHPLHLEPVTARENAHRSPFTIQSINAAKTKCDSGHPFVEANTYITPAGSRNCRICRNEAVRACRARQRLARRVAA